MIVLEKLAGCFILCDLNIGLWDNVWLKEGLETAM